MRHRIVLVALFVSAIMLSVLMPVGSQQVIQPAAPGTVQVQPPGAVGTTQIPFCLTTDSGGAAAADVNVPALGGKQIYVTGFEVMGDGATGQSVILVALSYNSVVSGNYRYNVVAGATTANPPLIVEFTEPVAAGPPGAPAKLAVPSFGTGNTASSAVLHGFYQ